MIHIFVWEKRDWSICKGYVTSVAKAEKVRDVLKKMLELREIYWFEEFTVHGLNLWVGGLKNIKLKGGEVIV